MFCVNPSRWRPYEYVEPHRNASITLSLSMFLSCFLPVFQQLLLHSSTILSSDGTRVQASAAHANPCLAPLIRLHSCIKDGTRRAPLPLDDRYESFIPRAQDKLRDCGGDRLLVIGWTRPSPAVPWHRSDQPLLPYARHGFLVLLV